MRMTVQFDVEHRSAEVTFNATQAKYNKVAEGTHKCEVLGLFQVVDEDDVGPYFVCELEDGRTLYAEPGQIRFTDRGITRC